MTESYKMDWNGDVLLVQLCKHHPIPEEVEDLERAIMEKMAGRESPKVVISWGHAVTSSHLLGKIVMIKKKLAVQNGKLKLCDEDPEGVTSDILKAAHLIDTGTLEVYPDVHSALTAFLAEEGKPC